MITFSNGRQAVAFAASGALGFDGRGWAWERLLLPKSVFDPTLFFAVTKTITWSPRKGNGWMKLRPIFRGGKLIGWVNALGLPNMGSAQWIAKIPNADFYFRDVVVSLASIEGDREERVGRMMAMVEALMRGYAAASAALEINVSCPNTESGKFPDADEIELLVAAAKNKTALPIIVKLSVAQDYSAIAKQLERMGLVEAISINSVPWRIVYPNRVSPLAKFGGGGVSGRAAWPWIMQMVLELAGASSIPVIGAGIWEESDISVLFALGAKAVSFGSVFIASPWWPTKMARKILREKPWMKSNGDYFSSERSDAAGRRRSGQNVGEMMIPLDKLN